MMTLNPEAESNRVRERDRESDQIQKYLREARGYLDQIGTALDNIEAVNPKESG